MLQVEEAIEFLESKGFSVIPLEEYDSLASDSVKLCALEMAGVDNWEGYDEAMSEYHNMLEGD